MRLITIDQTAPDARTTLADCRIALAAARGAALDDIDPSTGHDVSEQAYRTVRETWRQLLADRPALDGWMLERYRQARAYWQARRPVDDWPEM